MEPGTQRDTRSGSTLGDLLRDNQDWLTERILHYAKRQGYTRYTSTLAEAWRLSISGLTDSVIAAIDHYPEVPELGPEDPVQADPVASFGMLEAQKHRSRGVSLSMFLGLYKYYRQSYLDLLGQVLRSEAERQPQALFVERVFDRIEIAFVSEWVSKSEDRLLEELQGTNRAITNEKTAYLTVFESLLSPIILLDPEGCVRTLNHEAAKLVRGSVAPGASYYVVDPGGKPAEERHPRGEPVEALFPWLPGHDELLAGTAGTGRFECSTLLAGTEHVFEVRVSRLLDVSEKNAGTVIILNDVTQHKALAGRLDRLAKTDELTGTNNRRHFFDLANQEVKRARRHGRELSIMVIDVDHFKLVNDHYGHGAGDDFLVALTQKMQSTLRATDALGRIGGEEFAVLLPETPLEAAAIAAERLRAGVAQMVVPTRVGHLHATVSIGTATLHGPHAGFEELLRRADQALYRAKALGRNQFVAAEMAGESEEQGVNSGIAPRPESPAAPVRSWPLYGQR